MQSKSHQNLLKLKDLIKHNEQYLKSNDLVGFINNCGYRRSEIIKICEEIGINVFDYLGNQIPNGFFKGTDIEHVDIPTKITEIGENAFANCISLKTVKMSDDVTKMGASCFTGCTNLTDIYLSRKLEGIPEDCFSNCSSLKELDLRL